MGELSGIRLLPMKVADWFAFNEIIVHFNNDGVFSSRSQTKVFMEILRDVQKGGKIFECFAFAYSSPADAPLEPTKTFCYLKSRIW